MEKIEATEDLEKLYQHHQETPSLEVKGWLNLEDEDERGIIAKAIIAHANSGGGKIIIGLDTEGGKFIEDVKARPNCPVDATKYDHDTIQKIVRRYIDPEIHCHIHHILRRESNIVHPVIAVPGGHTTPIRSRSATPDKKTVQPHLYYMRKPGPRSEPPNAAGEWDELIRRCIENSKLDIIRVIEKLFKNENAQSIFENTRYGVGAQLPLGVSTQPLPEVENPNEDKPEFKIAIADTPTAKPIFQVHPDFLQFLNSSISAWGQALSKNGKSFKDQYPFGFWMCGYKIIDANSVEGSKIQGILNQAKGNETGWPVWNPYIESSPPYKFRNSLACFANDEDAAHADFWRVSDASMAFLGRGFQEDCFDEKIKPGKYIDVVIPIWRAAECMLHAARFAKEIGNEDSQILFYFRWEGLKDRKLTLLTTSSISRYIYGGRGESTSSTAFSTILVSARDMKIYLKGYLEQLLKPLYESFNFSSVPINAIERELQDILPKSR